MSPLVLLLGIAVVVAMGAAIVAVIEDDLDRRHNQIDRTKDTPVLDLRRWKR